jgi:hypothetical protein
VNQAAAQFDIERVQFVRAIQPYDRNIASALFEHHLRLVLFLCSWGGLLGGFSHCGYL